MVDSKSLSDEELYRHIVETIETSLGLNTDTLEVEVEDGFVSIWGSVPSIEDSEDLEKLLFDMLGLEDFDFDVVINSDLQTHDEYGSPLDEGGLNDLDNTPRRHF
ncbi:MAG: hypothetical protein ACLFN5_05920 [bacterium]